MTTQTLEPIIERRTTWKFNKRDIARMFTSGIEVGDMIMIDENKRYLPKRFVISLVHDNGKIGAIETVEKNNIGVIFKRNHRIIGSQYTCHLIDSYYSGDKNYRELNQVIEGRV